MGWPNFYKDRGMDLWKSVYSVSSQGAKKGRGKRQTRTKDLNVGQEFGDGKLKVVYPGLNADVLTQVKSGEAVSPKVIGEDLDREKRLTEIRNQMDRFKRFTRSPFDRGFTGSSVAGKSIGPPESYDDGAFTLNWSRVV